jgi:hypothetical protein
MFVTLDFSSTRKRLIDELDAIILQSKLKGESSIKTVDIAFIAAAIFFSTEPANAATLELYHKTFAEGLLEFGESLVLPFAEGFIYRDSLKRGIKYLKWKSIDKG